MESAELFEMLCREQDCWRKVRSFATDHARFQYFHAEDGYIDYIPHDNFRCEVILLSGLPGMGKDHYIRTLPQDIPVISLDAIRRKYKVSPTDKAANGRVVQEAKEEARSYLRKEQGFVWNATNTSKQMRSQLIDLFLTYGAKVKIVYIEKPYEVWRKQIVNGNLWFRKRYWIQCSGSWKFRNWRRHMRWCILSDSRQDTSLFVINCSIALIKASARGRSVFTKARSQYAKSL